jgi:hypothetical protein
VVFPAVRGEQVTEAPPHRVRCYESLSEAQIVPKLNVNEQITLPITRLRCLGAWRVVGTARDEERHCNQKRESHSVV